MRRLILASVIFIGSDFSLPAHAGVDRPLQFVVMAFDNCTELERWKEWSDFAAEMNKDGDRVHFTFFVSGVNFIATEKRSIYHAPRERRGVSRINFGGSVEEVRQRLAYINDMRRRGHEIASHAVGHFNGGSWSLAEWSEEFRSFREIASDIAGINKLSDGLDFPVTDIVGFRAPYLAKNSALHETLKINHFRYDASGDANFDAWPVKRDGIWRFNLANLRLHGTRRSVLSMDYNFLVAQSMGFSNPRHHAAYREQMLQTYLDYFRANYAGNRAPLHIGHHFSNYQGAVYHQALRAFARLVCGLPDVRCTTYDKLVDFMDSLDAATLAAYEVGDFPRALEPALTSVGAFSDELSASSIQVRQTGNSVRRFDQAE